MSDRALDELDREDMARLAKGDEASLDDLMGRHSERLFHYLLRIVQDETDASDLAQETFVRVYQNRTRFERERKFSTWLYAVATNLARDRLRWRSRHPEVALEAERSERDPDFHGMLPSPGASPSEALVAEERGEMVRRAVAALPEDLRIPLILTQFEERSHIEVATILDCTPKAVEMRVYRARQQLRNQLSSVMKDV